MQCLLLRLNAANPFLINILLLRNAIHLPQAAVDHVHNLQNAEKPVAQELLQIPEHLHDIF